jgi:hypothetical protein
MKATKDGYAAFMENKPSDVSMADQAGHSVSSTGTLKQAVMNGH